MKQNHPDISQHTLLTPLERELMTSIETWNSTLTSSINIQNSSQQDTESLLMQRLEALENSHIAFQDCQSAFNSALIGWADAPHSQEKKALLSQAIAAMKHLEKTASQK